MSTVALRTLAAIAILGGAALIIPRTTLRADAAFGLGWIAAALIVFVRKRELSSSGGFPGSRREVVVPQAPPGCLRASRDFTRGARASP